MVMPKGQVHPSTFPFEVCFRKDVLGVFAAYKTSDGPIENPVNTPSIPRGTPRAASVPSANPRSWSIDADARPLGGNLCGIGCNGADCHPGKQ